MQEDQSQPNRYLSHKNMKADTCLPIDVSYPASGNVRPGGSSGLGRFEHRAHRYCTVAGHYSRSPQPAALTENGVSGICSSSIRPSQLNNLIIIQIFFKIGTGGCDFFFFLIFYFNINNMLALKKQPYPHIQG